MSKHGRERLRRWLADAKTLGIGAMNFQINHAPKVRLTMTELCEELNESGLHLQVSLLPGAAKKTEQAEEAADAADGGVK